MCYDNKLKMHIVTEWNKSDSNIRNSKTLNIFISQILKFLRPAANSIFVCHNSIGVTLLTADWTKT